jgi:hypothetical protein
MGSSVTTTSFLAGLLVVALAFLVLVAEDLR